MSLAERPCRSLNAEPVPQEGGLRPRYLTGRRSLRRTEVQQEVNLVAMEPPGVERRRDVNASDWLKRLYDACARGDEALDQAIDMVLDTFDDLLFAQNESRCNELLQGADVERLAVEVTIAFLASTLRAREALSEARQGFYSRLEARLRREDPERADALLGGLR